MDPSKSRNEYTKGSLLESNIPENPFDLFESWLRNAFEGETAEPTAMTLATSDTGGRISSRIVLLKGYDKNGFQFFANYHSKKGKQLAENDFASLSFFWPELERQVRIEGRVKKLSTRDSDNYHTARPKCNQVSAWASNQSKPIKNRATLEAQFEAVQKVYEKADSVPRPPHWGGYIVKPDLIEFWQGREARLHDRIEYVLKNGTWAKHRLNP